MFLYTYSLLTFYWMRKVIFDCQIWAWLVSSFTISHLPVCKCKRREWERGRERERDEGGRERVGGGREREGVRKEEGERRGGEGRGGRKDKLILALLTPLMCSGTHGYMAPEVIKKGVQYTFTADWFSLGCVLYKLLRG